MRRRKYNKEDFKSWHVLDREIYTALYHYIEEQALIQGITTSEMITRIEKVLISGFRYFVWLPILRQGYVNKSLSIAYILNIIHVVSNDTDDFFRYYLNYRKQQIAIRAEKNIPEYVYDKHLKYVSEITPRKKIDSKPGIPETTRP